MFMIRTLKTLWSSRTVRVVRLGLGLLLLCVAFTGKLQACPVCPPPPPPGKVPEIDPNSMSGALTLLSGGVLVLTNRLRRK
jgi:hypothetical protein